MFHGNSSRLCLDARVSLEMYLFHYMKYGTFSSKKVWWEKCTFHPISFSWSSAIKALQGAWDGGVVGRHPNSSTFFIFRKCSTCPWK